MVNTLDFWGLFAISYLKVWVACEQLSQPEFSWCAVWAEEPAEQCLCRSCYELWGLSSSDRLHFRGNGHGISLLSLTDQKRLYSSTYFNKNTRRLISLRPLSFHEVWNRHRSSLGEKTAQSSQRRHDPKIFYFWALPFKINLSQLQNSMIQGVMNQVTLGFVVSFDSRIFLGWKCEVNVWELQKQL